jgi:hypothetical protein
MGIVLDQKHWDVRRVMAGEMLTWFKGRFTVYTLAYCFVGNESMVSFTISVEYDYKSFSSTQKFGCQRTPKWDAILPWNRCSSVDDKIDVTATAGNP